MNSKLFKEINVEVIREYHHILPDDIGARCVCVSSRFVRCIPSRTVVSSRMFAVIFWPWRICVCRVPVRACDMNRARVTQCRQWLHSRRVHEKHHVRFLKDKQITSQFCKWWRQIVIGSESRSVIVDVSHEKWHQCLSYESTWVVFQFRCVCFFFSSFTDFSFVPHRSSRFYWFNNRANHRYVTHTHTRTQITHHFGD